MTVNIANLKLHIKVAVKRYIITVIISIYSSKIDYFTVKIESDL